jgi:DNA-binding response OmpR family regulator
MATLGRVLVVDDDRDIVESIRIRLQVAGYEVVATYDGQQGVAEAIRCQPDAILLDLRMPKLDGMETLAQLKQRSDTQRIPIIMVSASIVNRQAALRAGASFFIVKPFDRVNLLAALNSVIRDGALSASSS